MFDKFMEILMADVQNMQQFFLADYSLLVGVWPYKGSDEAYEDWNNLWKKKPNEIEL